MKKILVTGSNGQLGSEIRKLEKDFPDFHFIFTDIEELEDNVKFIKNNGGTAFYRVADVSKFDQLKTAMEELIADMGGIDVLVNNAGIVKPHFIPETVEEIDQILDINLKGVIYAIHIALPYFRNQKKGSIMTTGSGSSLISTLKMINNNALYAASKAGINLFSFSLSQELSKRIKVNVLMPGWTDTDIVASASDQAIDSLVFQLFPFSCYVYLIGTFR